MVWIDRGVFKQQCGIRLLGGAVVGASKQIAIGIENLDDRVESCQSVIDIEPDLGPGCTGKAVEILICRFTKYTLNRESENQVLIGGGCVGR